MLYAANSNRAVDVAAEVVRINERRGHRKAISELSTERLEDLFEHQDQEKVLGFEICFQGF